MFQATLVIIAAMFAVLLFLLLYNCQGEMTAVTQAAKELSGFGKERSHPYTIVG